MFKSSPTKILLLALIIAVFTSAPFAMTVADEVTGKLETGSGKGHRVIFYSEKTSTSSSTSSGSSADAKEQSDSSSGGGGGGFVAMTGDETESGSSRDINDDNSVDKYDFSLMMSAWGTADSDADLNDDNSVDKYDFALLMSNWSGS